METTLAERTRDEWVVDLEAAGVLVGAVQTIEEVFSVGGVLPDHMTLTTDHAIAKRTRVMGNPIVIDGQHAAIRHQPPLLGEHTDDYVNHIGGGGGA